MATELLLLADRLRIALALNWLSYQNVANLTGGHRTSTWNLRPTRGASEAGIHRGERALLTEAEVQRSYSQLIYRRDVDEATFDQAESLVEELRPESPLRHRLLKELEELREIRGQS